MSHRRQFKDFLKQSQKTLLFSAQYEGNADILDDWATGIKKIKGLSPKDVYIVVNNSSEEFYQRVKAIFPKGTVINAGPLKDDQSMAIEGQGNLALTTNLYWLMSVCGNMAIDKAMHDGYEQLLILGGDDVLSPDGLMKMRKTLNTDFINTSNPDPVGVVVPVIVARGTEKDFDGTTAHATPIEFPTEDHEKHFFEVYRKADEITMYIPHANNQYGKKIFWAMGSSGMLISRDVFSKVRFDPERYKFENLYEKRIDLDNENNIEINMKYKGEDYDYCYRVQEAGYKIMMRTCIFILPLR
ncbi:glycosyltransferase family 2 protein [Sulfuricurvum sp.]|uniref:glycosyltransferase family 2 protein n=1 Tax=Sulfuricurvum sp. TaxID=2025608 RepID=UPI003562ED3B